MILENFKIKEQGSWNELKGKQEEIEKIITSKERDSNHDDQTIPESKLPKTDTSTTKSKSDETRSNGDSALYGEIVDALRSFAANVFKDIL